MSDHGNLFVTAVLTWRDWWGHLEGFGPVETTEPGVRFPVPPPIAHFSNYTAFPRAIRQCARYLAIAKEVISTLTSSGRSRNGVEVRGVSRPLLRLDGESTGFLRK